MSKKYILILFVSSLFTWITLILIRNQLKIGFELPDNNKEASIGYKDDPIARMEYERRMLADPRTGMIPNDIREKELSFAKNLPTIESIKLIKGTSVNTLTWSPRGPINRGGRTRALGIDVRTQTAPNITIIAAGVSGGVYKSTDNGTTWVNKLSPNTIHSATCIAQDMRTGQQNTWYIGTGESAGNSASESGAFFLGDGIYKSTDNGETWTLLPSTSNSYPQLYTSAFDFVFDVAVNTTTGSVFAAASNTIQRSTDGGNTWGTVRGSLSNNSYTDVQITSTGVLYATISSGQTNSGISRSSDDGASWTDITPASWPSGYGRTVIGIAPSNENIVYFWTYTGAGATQTQLWKYVYPGSGNGAGDGNWTNLTANLPAPTGSVAGINVQGQYDMIVKVEPDDANFVIVGGTNLYRSTDGFSTAVSPTGSTGWIGGYAIANNVSQYPNHHPDQHSMVFLSSDPKVLYSGHDGGLSKTTDVTASTVSWSNLNLGYITSQFYAIDIDPITSGDPVIAGGMQDNGNYITFSTNYNTGWIDWGHGGDGAFTVLRKTGANEYTIYLEAQNGWLWRQKYNTSGALQSDSFIQPSGTFSFVNPFILDPNNNDIMYFANSSGVIRSNNVSTSSPTWSSMTNATITSGSVSSFGISNIPANRLYVGGSNGKVLRIDGANTGDPSATDLSSSLVTAGASSGYVNCIYVDPSNADKVIVVYSNYNIRSLFYSTDGGTTWIDISGNLEQNPDGSGNGPSTRWVSAVHGAQTTYYVATSTGLYSTSNLNGSSTVWAQEGSSTIGNVVCPMVRSRDVDGLVVVGTHGMGVYSATQVLPIELTSFGASVSDNTVILNWETATEINNYGFDIERSNDNISWNKVGFVSGNGNSNSPKNYSFSDKGLQTSGLCYYRLKQIDNDGSYKYYDEIKINVNIINTFSLNQNYPNPFNPTTTINYSVPKTSLVTMKVYDISGREVKTLVNEEKAAGDYKIQFNGTNLASGIYFYRMQAGDFVQTKKLVLLK